MKHTKAIRGKIFKYFKDRLNVKLSTKGWYRSNCPYCGGKYCFGINLQKNIAKCFKCEERDAPIKVLMMMEQLETIVQARNFLNIQQEYEVYEEGTVTRYIRKDVKLPEGFISIAIAEGMMGKAAQRYMRKRGFDINDLAIRGVGYCLEGEYSGYVIFPFYTKGKLIFFQGRRFAGGGPKMKNPSNEEFGIGKTEIIYNQDALFMYNTINVVESITNALTLRDNTIAILGKSISDRQFNYLVSSPCKRINIILDEDAYLKAIFLGLSLINLKKVKVIRMPKEKDVNNIGRTPTMKIVKETPIRNWNQLMSEKTKYLNEQIPFSTHLRK